MIKREVALLDEQQQAELISYTLQLRCAPASRFLESRRPRSTPPNLLLNSG
jgi:hypothetical protein